MPENREQPELEGLSAERIVSAALERVESDGAAALTMRNLARALGTTPMALYRHVRDKTELETLVVDLHLEVRRALLGRPAAGRLAVEHWARSRGRARVQDRLFGILRGAGFEGPDVVIVADALELFTLGSVCHDLAAASADAAGVGRLAHVTVDLTPNLVDYSMYLARRDADVMFASGYAALLEGLEAALARGA